MTRELFPVNKSHSLALSLCSSTPATSKVQANTGQDLDSTLPKILANLESLHKLALATPREAQHSANENVLANKLESLFFEAVYNDDAQSVVRLCVQDGVDPNGISREGLVQMKMSLC